MRVQNVMHAKPAAMHIQLEMFDCEVIQENRFI